MFKDVYGWNYNHQTCHRDSPSRVLTDQLILGQKVKGQGHKVQKHIKGDQRVCVMHSVE